MTKSAKALFSPSSNSAHVLYAFLFCLYLIASAGLAYSLSPPLVFNTRGSIDFNANGNTTILKIAPTGNSAFGGATNIQYYPNNTLAVVGDLNVISSSTKLYPSLFVSSTDGNTGVRMVPVAPYALDVNGDARVSGVLSVGSLSGVSVPSDASIDANVEDILALRVPWADVNVANNITIKSSSDANFWQFLSTNRVYSVDNNSLSFFTNGSERVTVSADGNVGIGTATPSYKLQVNTGDTNTVNGIRLISGAGPASQFYLRPSNCNSCSNPISSAGDSGIFFDQGAQNTGAFVIAPWSTSTGGIRIGSDGNVSIASTSVTTGYRLDVTGNERVSGDLNVGQKATVQDLNVLNTLTVSGSLPGFVRDSVFNSSFPVLDANVDNNITIDTNKAAVFAGNVTARADLNALGGLNANTLRSFDNNALSLQTKNTARLTITADGNVGIGTAAPETTLQIDGPGGTNKPVGFYLFTSDYNAAMDYYPGFISRGLKYDEPADQFVMESDGANAGFSAIKIGWRNMMFFADGNTGRTTDQSFDHNALFTKTRLYVDYTGRIGINTSTPGDFALDINSSPSVSGERLIGKLNVINGDLNVISSATLPYPGLFVSGTDGNTGIRRTAGSGFALDVNGDARVSGVLSAGSISGVHIPSDVSIDANVEDILAARVPWADVNVANNITLKSSSDANFWQFLSTNRVYSVDNNSLAFFTNGSQRVTIGADGNVGVATSSPGNKLNVVGDLNIAPTATSAPSIYADSSGNVGIGTSSIATSKLNVSGDINTSGDIFVRGEQVVFQDNSSTNREFISTNDNSFGAGGSVFTFFGDTSLGLNSYLNPTAAIAATDGYFTNKVAINTDNNLLSNTLNVVGDLNVIPSVGLGYPGLFVSGTDGNTGIRRTAASGFALDVNGDARVSGVLSAGSISGVHIPSDVSIDANVEDILALRVPWADVNVANNITLKSSSDANFWQFLSTNRVYSVDNNTLSFYTNGVQRVTVDTDGNVGIGTTTPKQRLDLGLSTGVPGNLRVSNYGYLGTLFSSGATILGYNAKADTNVLSSNVLQANDNANANIGYAFMRLGTALSGIQFHIANGPTNDGNVASNMKMVLTYDGNLGIGTSATPAAVLYVSDVNGNGNTAFRVDGNSLNTTNTSFVINKDGNVGLGIISNLNNRLTVIGDLNVVTSATATPSLFVNSIDGNVGIGTSTPTAKLYVNALTDGGSTVSGIGRAVVINAHQPNILLDDTSATGSDYAIHLNESVLKIGRVGNLPTDINNDLVIATDGNIGIRRTPAEGFALDVNGDARISGDLNVGKKITVSDLNVLGTATVGTLVTSNISGFVKDSVFNGSWPVLDANVDNNITIDTNKAAVFAGNVTARADLNALGGLNTNTLRSFDNNALSLQTKNLTRVTVGVDGNVGFGTTAPIALVDVNGGVTLPGIFVHSYNINIDTRPFFALGEGAGSNSAGVNMKYDDNANAFVISTGVSGSWDVRNPPSAFGKFFIARDANRVGIGQFFNHMQDGLPADNVNMAATLDVNNGIGTDDTIRLRSANSGSQLNMLMTYDGSTVFQKGNFAKPNNVLTVIGDLNVLTSPTAIPSLYIDASTSNVGINTITANQDLNVSGRANFQSDVAGTEPITLRNSVSSGAVNYLLANASGNETLALQYMETATTSIPADVWKFRAGGTARKIVFSNSDTMGILTVDASSATGAVGVHNMTPTGYFDVNSGKFFVGTDGNVGIGTITPSNKLNVVGDLNVIPSVGLGYPGLFVSGTDGNTGIRRTAASGFALDVNGDARVSGVLSAGSISGVHIPSDVSIDANVEDILALRVPWADVNVANNITLKSSSDANFWQFLSTNRVYSVDNNTLSFYTNGVQRVTVGTDGNVGIGTATPQARLHIYGGNANSTTPQLIIGGGVSSNDISDLYVLDSNNVNTGVGFAAKVIGVNIQGQVNSANQVLQRTTWSGVTGAAAVYLGTDDVSQGAFGVLTAPQGSGAGTILTEKFTVRGDGNVGIGTASPSALLHLSDVNGLQSTALRVDGNSLIANATAFVITKDGNAAIALTAPTAGYRLDVNGNTRVAGDLNVGGNLVVNNVSGFVRDAVFNASFPVLDANVDNNITIDTNKAAVFAGNVTARADLNALGGLNTNTLRSLDNNTLNIQTKNLTRVAITADGNVEVQDNNYLKLKSNSSQIIIGSTAANDNMYLQHPFTTAAGFKRFVVGGNLRWDETAALWNYGASGSNDFSMVAGRAANSAGATGFYNKVSDSTSAEGGVSNTLLDQNYLRMIIRGDGNVGIGRGFVSSAALLHVSNTDANVVKIAFRVDGNSLDTASNSGYSRFIINNDGNVGIGAGSDLNALATLHVQHRVRAGISSTAPAVVGMFDHYTNGGSGGPIIQMRVSDGGAVDGSETLGRISGWGTVDASTFAEAARIDMLAPCANSGSCNLGWGPAAGFGDILFSNDNNTGIIQERMRIRYDGNVGVGTAIPSALLHVSDVNGNANVALRVDGNSLIANATAFVITKDGNAAIALTAPTAGYRLDVNGNTRVAGDLNVGGNLVVNNVSGFVRDAVFNASFPVLDANVDNNITIDTNKAAVFGGSLISRADLNALGGLNANTIRSFDNNAMNLQTQNTTRVTVGADGNVGLGITTPAFPLDVERSTTVTAGKFGNTLPTYIINNNPTVGLNAYYDNGWKYGKGSTAHYGGVLQLVPSTGQLIIGISAAAGSAGDAVASMSTKFAILQDGNTGINTSSPKNRLSVIGDLNVAASLNSAPTLLANNAGNVGIGTGSPTQKLDVAGDVNLSTSAPTITFGGAFIQKNSGGDVIISD